MPKIIRSQVIDTLQQKKILVEQQNLKDHKITYEEYQIRHQSLTKNTDTLPVSILFNKSTAHKKEIRLRRPGDELITFGKKFYLGLGITIIGSAILTLGAINAMATRNPRTGRTTPNPTANSLMFIGAGTMVFGTTFSILSFKHIKRAGELLNQTNGN